VTHTQDMTALERVTFILAQMRIAGGWDDESAARQVLAAVGLDDTGKPLARHDEAPPAPQMGGK
jgi:hypothetical protein